MKVKSSSLKIGVLFHLLNGGSGVLVEVQAVANQVLEHGVGDRFEPDALGVLELHADLDVIAALKVVFANGQLVQHHTQRPNVETELHFHLWLLAA